MGRRRRRRGGPDGVVVVDKPAGPTSHDVVADARRRFDTGRVGHAGTLDPDATGVLVLGVGRATRLLRFVSEATKTYTVTIVFGTETDTLDASGTVVATHEMDDLTLERVRSAAARFVGEIEQIPPMVSAVRVEGRRLHELARAGIEVERAPRRVRVDRFEIQPTSDPVRFTATVECSSGTYIRSLAADLGTALGGGAHVCDLRRTAVGSFRVEEAEPVERAELLPTDRAVQDLPRVEVDDAARDRVRHGAVLDSEHFEALGPNRHGPVAVFSRGELLAVYEPHRGRFKPSVVLAARTE